MEDRVSSPTVSEDASVEELRRAARRAERLFEINARLGTMRDPDALLRYIIETAADVLECEAASVLLYDEDTEQLHFVAATGSDAGELAGVPVPLDDSLAGFIFTNDRPLLVGDVTEEARHYEPAARRISFDARSLVGVPMRLEGRVVGVLEGLNKRRGPFGDEDARALSILAAQAAVAIRNASQMQELEKANRQLSRFDELKSDFLALASHELRTPLATILGFGDVLREQATGPLAEPIEMVMDAAHRMNDVVETMTQMEALRRDAAQLDVRPVALHHVLRRACNDAALGKPDGAARLSLEHPEQELMVMADAKRLGLVFTNLIENAFAFSPPDGRVTVHAARDKQGEAHVTVRDEGIGLTEEETERVFEDFYQVEDPLSRTHEGLGLGLTMARELTRLHGGRLHAESAGPGEGSTFHLHLPLREE